MTEKPPELVSQSWPRFAPQNGHVKVIGFIGSRSGIETESFAMERMVSHPFSGRVRKGARDNSCSIREVPPKESNHVLIEFPVKSGSVKARWINANDSGIG